MGYKLISNFKRSSVIIAFALCAISCDESLPPRVEPERFLKAAVSVRPNSVVELLIDSTRVGSPITITGTQGRLDLVLKSFFNEALQERPFIKASVDVWLTSQPTVKTKVLFTEVDVEVPYIEPGGFLTLIPGDSVMISKQWSHIADNGRGFWNFVQLRGGFDGRNYFLSSPVRFTAVGSVQVFENVPPEKTPPYEFSLIYKVYVIYPP